MLGAGRVNAETAKALLVALKPSSLLGEQTVWIPKSAIHDDSEIYDAREGNAGTLVVERWLARERGWETE